VGRGQIMHMNESSDHLWRGRACEALWFWRELRKQTFLGAGIVGQCFLIKMRNKSVENLSDWERNHNKIPCLVDRKIDYQVPVKYGEHHLSLIVAKKKKKLSLSGNHDLSRGFLVEKYCKRNCAYGWVDKGKLLHMKFAHLGTSP